MANRSNVRAACAFVFIVTSLGAAFGACTQYRAYDGDQCLKDEDCLGGVCVAYTCTAPAPTFSGTPARDSGQDTGSSSPDSGGDDDTSDAGDDGPDTGVDAGHDSAVVVDSGQDAADTSVDPVDAADATDAENDVSSPSDASDDADDANDAATGVRETQADSLLA